jgi:F-type H+-transporting ATPase subunit delta
MAEPTTIARPYAEAVFKLAQQGGTLVQWSQVLARIAAFAGNADVVTLLGDPKLTDAQRVALFFDVIGADVSPEVRNFVQVLAENNRLVLLPEIQQRFEEYKNDVQGVVDAQIDTAFPLDEAQLRSLVGDLERRFKRRINPKVNVDSSLIGGVKVVVGDTVIDGSIRAKLAGMSASLLKA